VSILAVCGQSRPLVSVAADDCIFYASRERYKSDDYRNPQPRVPDETLTPDQDGTPPADPDASDRDVAPLAVLSVLPRLRGSPCRTELGAGFVRWQGDWSCT
jgi:hypothetical protein